MIPHTEVDPARGALRLGVDLGGTKTEAVVIRLRDGAPEVLSRVRQPTGRDDGYQHVIDTVVATIHAAAREAGLRELPTIGVGMPGSVQRGTDPPLCKNSNTTCLNGRPFRRDLQHALSRPVAFANDANCFALAEALLGAGRGGGHGMVFGVILGTGVGGGVVVDGRIWDGLQGIAGEWGHIVIDDGQSGPPCYCGRRGCVEQYLSGPAIEAAYAARSGRRRPLRELAADPADGHRDEVFAQVAARFGRALATVINILDPDLVVLGGGVSQLPLFYQEGREQVARWVFNDRLDTPIVQHQLGDSAGVLGAALLPTLP